MKFLLDTNALISLRRGHAGFVARLRRHAPGDFAVSSIVAHELYFGAYKGSRVKENLDWVQALRFEVLEFDHEDARRAGEVRAILERQGNRIGPYDVLIAGHALSRSLVLITHNVREFERVPKLAVDDWES